MSWETTTKSDLAYAGFCGSGVIATGLFFIIKGLSHNFDFSLGMGIFTFCLALYFIIGSKSFKEAWEDAEDN